MLSRKEIEARVKHYDAEQGAGLSSGGVFDGKVYHEREVWDAALALYDENERLKDNIDGWKAVMKKTIGADAADAIKGLEAENTRLREELKDAEALRNRDATDILFMDGELKRLREGHKKLVEADMKSFNHRCDLVSENEVLRADNARLREERTRYNGICHDAVEQLETIRWLNEQNADLREWNHNNNIKYHELMEVVEAAKKARETLLSNRMIAERASDAFDVLDAALEGLEGK